MSSDNLRVLLLLCNKCKRLCDNFSAQFLKELKEEIIILPVACPAQIDPFVYIKLLKYCCDIVVIVCPKEVCCCPRNKRILKRHEILKDLFPVFGFSREQYLFASISPLGSNDLKTLISENINFVKMTKNFNQLTFIDQNIIIDSNKWLN
jgi:coenzyme F420-reducing hydrogenase delta subunit